MENKLDLPLNSKMLFLLKKPLDILHMDLFGPSKTASLGGNLYTLVIVDVFSRFTWTLFIDSKNDAFDVFKKLAKVLLKTIAVLHPLEVIMGESFKMKDLMCFVKNMGLQIVFLLQ